MTTLSLATEKRLYTRFPSEMPVDLVLTSGAESGNSATEFHLQTVNLSVKGVEVTCDDDVIQTIRRQNSFPCHCQLVFNFPNQSTEITVRAQVVTHRRTSQHSYHLALIFVDLSDQQREVLEQYLLDLRFQEKTPSA